MIWRYGVIGLWLVVAFRFVLRKRYGQVREVQRGRNWKLGVLLQALAVWLVWGIRRHTLPGMAEGIPALVLGAASAWLMVASQRALGRQWAYEPRLVEGHQLISSGPYALVRNPIYTGFYGMALATALVFSQWIVIPVFTAIFALGTALRIRSEEQLLRGRFGPEFEEYARRVPAVIPWLRW